MQDPKPAPDSPHAARLRQALEALATLRTAAAPHLQGTAELAYADLVLTQAQPPAPVQYADAMDAARIRQGLQPIGALTDRPVFDDDIPVTASQRLHLITRCAP